MIRQIVDRCHVGDSDLAVIRYLVSRFKRKYKTWIKMPRGDRRTIMREALRIHHDNQKTYRLVMG
jgi:hypothetical protein